MNESNAQSDGAEPREDGVDLTLIRWMLSLTPMERLRVLQNTVTAIASLRELALRGDGSLPASGP